MKKTTEMNINEKTINIGKLTIDEKDLKGFIKYINDFYGRKGIYPNKYGKDLQPKDIIKAIIKLSQQKPKHEWEWDSLDRELVRDELIGMKLFDYPTKESAVKEISEVGKIYEEIEIDKDGELKNEISIPQLAKLDAEHLDRHVGGKSEKEVKAFVDRVYKFYPKDVRQYMVDAFMDYQKNNRTLKYLTTVLRVMHQDIRESVNESVDITSLKKIHDDVFKFLKTKKGVGEVKEFSEFPNKYGDNVSTYQVKYDIEDKFNYKKQEIKIEYSTSRVFIPNKGYFPFKTFNDIKNIINNKSSLKESVNEYNVNKKFGSKYDIGAGQFPTGTVFWNRAEDEDGDYKKIAHVDSDTKKITFYDKSLPSNVKKHIEDYAKQK